jgi:hypothetical protein
MRSFWSTLLLTGACCSACTSAGLRADVKPEGVSRAKDTPIAVPRGNASLALEPGTAAELELAPDGTVHVRLATPGHAERFVLVVASALYDVDDREFAFSVTAGAHGDPSPAKVLDGCSISSERFRGAALDDEPVPSGKPPAEGATNTLSVPTKEGASSVQARALSVGEHAVIWADTTNPSTLDREFVLQFREDFEKTILPRARAVFGTEPDVDGNGRINLVFSKLTRDTGVAFFTSCDLLPAEQGCVASNRGEYLYLTPPDAIARPYNTPNAIKEILAHEASHLLHFNRKVLKNRLSSWHEGVYASEGLGALAQDVTGYQSGNLYVALAGLQNIDAVSFGELLLEQRSQEKPRDGILRGAAYWLMRYLYDSAGGDAVNGLELQNRGGPAFIRALIDSPKPVGLALAEVAGVPSADIALDFYTALGLSGREAAGGVTPQNACFRFLPTVQDPVTQKQRGANPYAAFHGQQMSGPKTSSLAAADGKLRQGGVDYLTLEAAPNEGELAFTLRVDPRAAPRVRVGRIR